MKDRFGFDWSHVTGTHFWRMPHFSRRVFFRHLASAVGGYYLLPSRPMENVAKAAASPINRAKNCIFILLSGAPSHADTFDLKEGAWTPSFFNPTSYGDLRFPQGLMPKMADQLDNIAFVRSVRSWAAVHGLAQTWAQIGRNPTSSLAKIAPHIGSVVSYELGGSAQTRTMPAFVSLNVGGGPASGYFSPEHAPFYISPGGGGLGNTSHRDGQPAFERRYNLLNDLDGDARNGSELGSSLDEMASFNLSARKLMYNSSVDKVFTFDATERARFGTTGFGNACIVARNLLQSNLGTRFIQITLGGWDHHSMIYQPNSNLQAMTRQLDNGLGTLIADLKTNNLLDDTLIVAMGEFGRTVGPLNSQSGRDHFLQLSVMFAGGGVRGKRTVGKTDATGSTTTDPGWSRNRDVRPEDVEATIYSALGIDWTKVLHNDPLGRGFEYVPFAASQDLYGPIHELWS